MPGPASGGGSFGGGSGGGSFGGGGGYHGHYGGYRRGPRFGFFPFGFYRPFGFFGGGFFGLLMLPIIFILIAAILLSSMVYSAVSNVVAGGVVSYDERAYQTYAMNEYYEHFDKKSAATFEDNVLISVLINETYDYGYFIAITGNNVSAPVVTEFRADGNYTFARAMNNFVSKYYENSLQNDLANVVDTLAASVSRLEDPLRRPSGVVNLNESKLVNDSSLKMDTTYLEYSLNRFKAETGIPLVLVVDEMEDVFGKNIPIRDLIVFILLIALLVFGIVLLIKNIRRRKRQNNSGYGAGPGGYGDSSSGNYRYGYGGGYNNGYNSGNYNNNGNYYN